MCSAATVGAAVERKTCPSDGNCAFHAIADGLAWLASGKGDSATEFSHVELRARATAHDTKYRTHYELEWGDYLPLGIEIAQKPYKVSSLGTQKPKKYGLWA